MKKIYLSIFTLSTIFTASAQLSLTKAFNEPVLGDVDSKQGFDSVAVLPNGVGANQLWDFSALTTNTVVQVTTFTTVASTPSAAAYPSATIADSDGTGAYNYYKATATQYELVGLEDPNLSLNLSNSAVIAVWPITMGYTNTDALSGTATSSFAGTGTASGTITTDAVGTGTLIVPGGGIFTNVLRMRAQQSVNASFAGGLFTATLTTTDYSYYHASQKFPLLTVSYSNISGAISSTSGTIRANSAVVTGINDVNFDGTFSIFPNPAKNNFNVKLYNSANANCTVEIINSIGQTTQTIHLGSNTEISNSISISDLSSGVYIVKTTLGNKQSVRKLIVE